MSKETPKPWSVHGRMKDCVTFVGRHGEENLFLQNVDGYFACQNEEDAKLIAAAPELLAALIESRQVIATALKVGAPDWFDSDEKVAQHTTVKKIDAAITKATA